MEERKAKILFTKSGRGSATTRVTIPITWVRHLELTPEDREVTLCLEDNKITIKKATTM